jgi:hypothetical protein
MNKLISLYAKHCNGKMTKTKIREFKNSTQPFYSTGKMSYNRVARQNLVEGESRNTTVWCPTTKHGTWICRSDNGQVFVTGNTKAKRRITLSISGMGWTDESEIDSIPGAKVGNVNLETGEIIEIPLLPIQVAANEIAKQAEAFEENQKLENVKPKEKLQGYDEFVAKHEIAQGTEIYEYIKILLDKNPDMTEIEMINSMIRHERRFFDAYEKWLKEKQV